jgi:catechol 2,3-dioxygenase-like lactoylglutathione lyase family enzyme
MKMTAPLEIGICCRDLDRLAAFYLEVLGCTAINDLEVPAEKAAPSALAGAAYRVARLQTPWGERLKLLQPSAAAEAPPPAARWILQRQGLAYVTFILDDLRTMLARLQAAGVEVLTGPEPVEVRPGTFLVFVRDPEGNVLEFVEYAEIAAYRPDCA